MKCKSNDNLKLEIEYLHKSLSKFIRGIDNHDMNLSDKKHSYNKVAIDYHSNNNAKSFKNI